MRIDRVLNPKRIKQLDKVSLLLINLTAGQQVRYKEDKNVFEYDAKEVGVITKTTKNLKLMKAMTVFKHNVMKMQTKLLNRPTNTR